MVTRRRPPPPTTKPARALAGQKPAQDRRALFIAAYLLDPNATQAAISAGYSPHSAHAQGHRLLKDAEVAAEIERHQQRVSAAALERYEISHDRIKAELARLAFSNVLDFGRVDRDGTFAFDMSATTRDEAAALKSMKTKRTRRTIGRGEDATVIEDVETSFQLADKRAALVDLGKAVGLFSDGPDVSVPVTFIVERTERSKKLKDPQ